MERKEILEKLKSTEAEIRRNIEVAQHKRNEIVASAQKHAQKLEDDGEQRLKREREELLSVAKKQIDEERARKLKKATTAAEEFKKKARVQKAKEVFIERFKEYIHV
jgi:vacuolar-type H+-ATPase subunit H